MIIDNKGKLFGKINIIDLFILIVFIGGIAFVGLRFVSTDTKTLSTNKKIEIKYYIEEANDFVVKRVKKGDALSDDNRNISLGIVSEDPVIMPSVSWGIDEKGNFVKSSREGFNSMIITGVVDGTLYENGAVVNSSKYTVGHSFVLKAGDGKFYLRVYDINVKE